MQDNMYANLEGGMKLEPGQNIIFDSKTRIIWRHFKAWADINYPNNNWQYKFQVKSEVFEKYESTFEEYIISKRLKSYIVMLPPDLDRQSGDFHEYLLAKYPILVDGSEELKFPIIVKKNGEPY